MSARILRIAQLNDALRTSFVGGEVVITSGIASLDDVTRAIILSRVQGFTGFTPDNDPHGERDFGSFDLPDAERVFWKIDYYDRNLEYGSEDPANPAITRRVLTIMLASEY